MTRRYPNYKSTGIDWLPEVPAHWDTQRLKNLFGLKKRPVREGDGIVTAFRDGTVTLRSNRREDGFTNSILEIGYQGVRKGDLVIHAMDGFAGAIGVSDSDGKSTPVYSICKPRDGVSSYFFGRLLRHMALAGFVNALAKGVRERSTEFRWADARGLPLPVPPLSEQTAITRFLDRETAKIDTLVEEQRRLIELLREKRQAVISHAVTKGLNPAAPMKPSGVEWLGDVPEGWDLVQLRRLVDQKRRITYGIVQPGLPDQTGRFMVRGQDYSSGWSDPEDIFRVSRDVEEPYRRARLSAGDLVITIVGAGTGNVAVVPEFLNGANITQTTARVAPNKKLVDPGFLRLSLVSTVGSTQVALFQKGAAQPGLNLEHLNAFQIPVPPIEEQHEISAYIESVENGIEPLLSAAEEAEALLLERRAALITAAVTGKINVQHIDGGRTEAA